MIVVVLLKHFEIEKCGLPLPNPTVPLNQQSSSTPIEESNKEITAALYNSMKRQPYLKISLNSLVSSAIVHV